MRDEVNIWFVNPPKPLPPMPAPWNFLFFWYEVPDVMTKYREVLIAQLQRTHIFIFLTNYASLLDARTGQEIDFAVKRRINTHLHDFTPIIFPIITSPCQWQRDSRLSGFKPLGPKKSLAEAKIKDEAYLDITEQLSQTIRSIQTTLNETRFAISKMTPEEQKALAPNTYLDGDDRATQYTPPSVSYPPEWLGWSIVLLIFISIAGAVYRQSPRIIRKRGDNAEQHYVRPQEYRREYPITPPPEADSTAKK
jgi:hypothetical protein